MKPDKSLEPGALLSCLFFSFFLFRAVQRVTQRERRGDEPLGFPQGFGVPRSDSYPKGFT